MEHVAYFIPPPAALDLVSAWLDSRTAATGRPSQLSHVEWFTDYCRWRGIDPAAGWEFGHAYEFKRTVAAVVAARNRARRRPQFFELGRPPLGRVL